MGAQKQKTIEPRECKQCGNLFTPVPTRTKLAEICSDECRKERAHQHNIRERIRRKELRLLGDGTFYGDLRYKEEERRARISENYKPRKSLGTAKHNVVTRLFSVPTIIKPKPNVAPVKRVRLYPIKRTVCGIEI